MFIHILRSQFLRDEQESIFNSKPLWSSQKESKEHYRKWLKYIKNDSDIEESSKQYYDTLMKMEWEGYPLLVLRSSKLHEENEKIKELWKCYVKTHIALIENIKSQIYWENGIPYKNKTTSNRQPMKAIVNEAGCIQWTYDKSKE